MYNKMSRRLAICALLFPLFYGCAPLADTTLLQELSENTPDLEIEEPQYVFIRNSARIVRVSAEAAEFFTSRKMQQFTNIAFIELDRNNNTLNSGSADSAIYSNDTGNFELFGNVVFQSVEQSATFESAYILWNETEQKLFGREEGVVVVTRLSGTRVEGQNLVADLANRVIEFKNGSGIISPKDAIRSAADESSSPSEQDEPSSPPKQEEPTAEERPK